MYMGSVSILYYYYLFIFTNKNFNKFYNIVGNVIAGEQAKIGIASTEATKLIITYDDIKTQIEEITNNGWSKIWRQEKNKLGEI